jgi:hypothetical protein
VFSQKTPVGFEKITVSSTAVGCDATKRGHGSSAEANYALFRCETNDVRWRDDGSAPTATDGQLLAAGEVLEYDGDLVGIEFIRKGGSDGTVMASYYNVQKG